MSCAVPFIDHPLGIQQDTIIPGDTYIPFTCDQCSTDTDIALNKVIAGQQFVCAKCAARRTILPAEVKVIRQFLNQYGFYFR